MFYLVSETKYVTYWLNCAYSDLLVAWQYIGITQKPHDHLLKKSWQPGLANFEPKWVKIPKTRFQGVSETIYVIYGLNWAYSVILDGLQYCGITQKPRDHL